MRSWYSWQPHACTYQSTLGSAILQRSSSYCTTPYLADHAILLFWVRYGDFSTDSVKFFLSYSAYLSYHMQPSKYEKYRNQYRKILLRALKPILQPNKILFKVMLKLTSFVFLLFSFCTELTHWCFTWFWTIPSQDFDLKFLNTVIFIVCSNIILY